MLLGIYRTVRESCHQALYWMHAWGIKSIGRTVSRRNHGMLCRCMDCGRGIQACRQALHWPGGSKGLPHNSWHGLFNHLVRRLLEAAWAGEFLPASFIVPFVFAEYAAVRHSIISVCWQAGPLYVAAFLQSLPHRPICWSV